MLDMFHIPEGSTGAVRWFFNYRGATTSWVPYHIPRGHNFVFIFAVGGGGGGGGGFTRTAGNDGGGGGGGSSGVQLRGLWPRASLPDVLYVAPGLGAAGGAASTDGGDGSSSRVSVAPDTNQINRLVAAGQGLHGFAGIAAGPGSGGSVNTGTAADSPFYSAGQLVIRDGQAGAAGGSQTGGAGTNITWGNNGTVVSGGAGGAGSTGVDFAGGNITGAGLMPTISGGAANGGAGGAGYTRLLVPFLSSGGSGGGSDDNATGGAGGIGGWGSGGGGGGAGATGGRGGDGGSGLVLIASW